MNLLHRYNLVFFVLALIVSLFGFSSAGYGQKTITYQTEDGWTIYGTFYPPDGSSGIPAPAVLMLTEPGWDTRSNFNVPALPIAKRGMGALAIDVRGTTGQSVDKNHFGGISLADQKKTMLDIRGAMRFLAAQKEIDPHRLAIMGTGITANDAALQAAESADVVALVLISGELSPEAKEVVKVREDLPVLSLAGKNDRRGVKDMAEIYELSKNENSDLILALGRGTVMFSHVGALAGQVADWLTANLQSLGSVQEISFKAEDGVVMRGRLRIPDLKDGSKAPGVVFVHGANHDQGTYYDLARAATKKGLATLTFDRRGKNEDPELANHNAERLAPEQRGAAYRDDGELDVKAAIQFMASQKQVDPNRIALVAATAGVAEAVKAAVGDVRIKTLVMLTVSSLPSADGIKYLSTADVPIFTAASSEDVNDRGNLAEVTRQTYELSASKRSQFLLYDNAGRGTEMLKYKPELQTMVVRWLTEKLGATNFLESKKAAKSVEAK